MCIQPNATVFLGKLCYYHNHHVLLLVFLSLGQACNHVAALLFFIEHHASTKQDVLATVVSRTSKPMAWNRPPKKEVNPARAKDIKFVKPSHGDLQATDDARPYKRHDFDPRQPKHRVLDINSVTSLLEDIKESMPNTGLKQFWERNAIHSSLSNPERRFHHGTMSSSHMKSTPSFKRNLLIYLLVSSAMNTCGQCHFPKRWLIGSRK